MSIERMTACTRNPLLRKPMTVVLAEEAEEKLARRLSLFDLLAIGIGGTVGSGVFVLAGAIANAIDHPAGPAVCISFLAAGIGCIFSGLSFAELSSRIPSAGSSYAYAYVNLGEAFAFVAGCCLTLEYGVSSAAVARNWGDKLTDWVRQITQGHDWGVEWNPGAEGSNINIYAGIIEFICLLIMLRGVNLSKTTVDVFTLGKISLVLFMTIGGLVLYKPGHMKPFAPSGFKGIFRGSMHSFFGYLGYDEVCCLAAEAKNPVKNIPLAVMGCITGVTVLYVLTSLALVGMQSYQDISRSSGFSEAFLSNNWKWAADLVAAGELITLPLVVLVSLLAQPRLQYAMAEDGLLPKIFSRVDSNGNLFMGTLVCGIGCITIAIFLPFAVLEDMISAGVLIAFNLTNSGLIVFRRSNLLRPTLCRWLVALFNLLAIIAAFSWAHLTDDKYMPLKIIASLALIAPLAAIEGLCPEQMTEQDDHHFKAPFVPWLPAIGAAFNWFLLAQLTWQGIYQIAIFIAASLGMYFIFGYRHSVGAKTGWRELLASARRRRHSSEVTDPDLITQLLDEDHHNMVGSSSSPPPLPVPSNSSSNRERATLDGPQSNRDPINIGRIIRGDSGEAIHRRSASR